MHSYRLPSVQGGPAVLLGGKRGWLTGNPLMMMMILLYVLPMLLGKFLEAGLYWSSMECGGGGALDCASKDRVCLMVLCLCFIPKNTE